MAGQYIRAVVYNEKHQSIADHLYEGKAAEVIAKPDALHALVNALEGYNPDAVRDVVEALRDIAGLACCYGMRADEEELRSWVRDISDMAESAIAKIEGGAS